MFRIAISALILVSPLVRAQLVPSLHPYSGMEATAAKAPLERAGARPAGPRGEALGYGSIDGPAVRRALPAFRFDSATLQVPQVQDVVYLAEGRPVRLRVHLGLAGGSFATAWAGQLRRCFDSLDRDGNGTLNPFEADFLFPLKKVQGLIENTSGGLNMILPPFEKLDIDGDGRVSFDEFQAYYVPAAPLLLKVLPVGTAGAPESVNEALFHLLDRNGDGRVTANELAAADRLVGLRDNNDDECISSGELFSSQIQPYELPDEDAPVARTTIKGTMPALPKTPAKTLEALMAYPPGAIPDTVIEQILTRYDKNKDLRLDPKEVGLDPAMFAKLDKNGDGQLGIAELLAWRDLPPDAELDVVAGAEQTLCNVTPRSKAAGVSIGKLDDRFVVRVGGGHVEFAVQPSKPGSANYGNVMELFNEAAKPDKPHITEADVKGPRFQPLRIVFDDADRDGDGKLTKKELSDFLDLRGSFAFLPFHMTYAMETPSLFRLLDVNGDNRLSVRELRNAGKRLAHLTADGALTRESIRAQPVVRFGRSFEQPRGYQTFNEIQYATSGKPASSTAAPSWFRKMDRNGDGDISRAEFPGRAEDFDKLDLDHDGLISADEADAAEKKFRAAEPKK